MQCQTPDQSVNIPDPPPATQPPCPGKKPHRRRPTQARKDDQAPILLPTLASLQNCPCDGNARQAAKTNQGIASSVVSPIILHPAQLPDTHRGEGDGAPARKAKDQRVQNHQRDRLSRRQPQRQGGDQAQQQRQDHGVEAPDLVRHQAGEIAAKARAYV